MQSHLYIKEHIEAADEFVTYVYEFITKTQISRHFS